MKTGYDDFFKKAQKQTPPRPSVSPQFALKSAPRGLAGVSQKRKKVRGKKRFAWSTVFVCFLGLGATGWAFVYADQIENFLQRVEVSWMASASANEAAPAKAKADGAAESAKGEEGEKAAKGIDAAEIDHLSKLTARSKELDAREEEISRQEAELAKMKEELEKRLAELSDVRGKISDMLADRVKGDEQKIETLVQVYSNMKPIQAAKIFESMDQDLAVEILAKMKKKNAADIMNLIKPDKAQVFSELYAGYTRKPANK